MLDSAARMCVECRMASSSGKFRANLYLTKEIYDRARAAVEVLPGRGSLSQLVDEILQEMLPMLEAAAGEIKKGRPDVADRAAARQFGEDFMRMVGALGGDDIGDSGS